MKTHSATKDGSPSAGEPHAFSVLSADLLARGYLIRFRVSGTSMHPAIRDGEVVNVEPVDASRVRRGDIVLARTPAGIRVHRVVAIGEEQGRRSFLLKGDTLRTCDGPAEDCQVLGRVLTVERGGSHRDPQGRRARAWSILWRLGSRAKGWLRRPTSATPGSSSGIPASG